VNVKSPSWPERTRPWSTRPRRAFATGRRHASPARIGPGRASHAGRRQGIRPRQTRKRPKGLEPPRGPCQRTSPPENARSETFRVVRMPIAPEPSPRPVSLCHGPYQGGSPAEVRTSIGPCHRTNPHGVRRHERMDRPDDSRLRRSLHGPVPLRLRGRSFGEDLVQRGHRQDLVVLALIATHPGAETRGLARAVGATERVVTRNLSRLTEDGLLVLVEDDADPALRSYRLASWPSNAGRNIGHDPRLPKPGIA
jgi:hypothetical protein